MAKLIDDKARGVWIISATPFAENGDLDLESTDRMVDYYLGCGVDGLTILGIMGEASKLSLEESTRFTAQVVKRVAGKVPVVVGVSAPATASPAT